MDQPEDEWPSGYDRLRKAQRQWIARETTPQQRLEWLEEMLFMLWENGYLPSKFDGKPKDLRSVTP